MRVREIMTKDVELISPRTTVCEAACIMRDCRIGALPIGANDRLVGMITDRDIAVRAVADDRIPSETAVGDVMSEQICYCFEDDDLQDAASVMADAQVRRLPVLNHNKRLVGLISLADIANRQAEASKDALIGISEPTGVSRSLH